MLSKVKKRDRKVPQQIPQFSGAVDDKSFRSPSSVFTWLNDDIPF